MAKVSVIMPVFNCEEFVEEAVRSVLNQTERDLELIVVNDGSTDRTPELVEKLASTDVRIRVHTQKHSGKCSMARNAGLSKATGKYLTFLDGDDLSHPEKVERELAAFDSVPEVDLVFSDMKVFGKTPHDETSNTYLGEVHFMERASAYLTEITESLFLCSEDFYRFMSTQITGVTVQTVMFRRSLLEKDRVWFPEDITVAEDIDFWFRLARCGRLAFINEVLAYYRRHEKSITSDPGRALEGSIFAHSRNLERGRDILSKEEIRTCEERIAMNYFYFGVHHFQNSEVQIARDAYRKSWALKPRPRTVAAYLKTYVPAGIVKAYRKRFS